MFRQWMNTNTKKICPQTQYILKYQDEVDSILFVINKYYVGVHSANHIRNNCCSWRNNCCSWRNNCCSWRNNCCCWRNNCCSWRNISCSWRDNTITKRWHLPDTRCFYMSFSFHFTLYLSEKLSIT